MGFDPNVDDTARITTIREHREKFGLYDSSDLTNHFGGYILVRPKLLDTTEIRLELESSLDLESWTSSGDEISVPFTFPGNTRFYRVILSEDEGID